MFVLTREFQITIFGIKSCSFCISAICYFLVISLSNLQMGNLEMIAVVIYALLWAVSAMIEEMPVPPKLMSCFESHYKRKNVSSIDPEKINFACTQKYVYTQIDHPALNLSQEAKEWMKRLIIIPNHRRKRQNLRIRREYRRLSDQERDQFHNAIIALKVDTVSTDMLKNWTLCSAWILWFTRLCILIPLAYCTVGI